MSTSSPGLAVTMAVVASTDTVGCASSSTRRPACGHPWRNAERDGRWRSAALCQVESNCPKSTSTAVLLGLTLDSGPRFMVVSWTPRPHQHEGYASLNWPKQWAERGHNPLLRAGRPAAASGTDSIWLPGLRHRRNRSAQVHPGRPAAWPTPARHHRPACHPGHRNLSL